MREALRLETHVKGVIIFSFCIGGTSEKRENRNKIDTNSSRDLILGSYPLPQTSLSVLEEIRVLPKIQPKIFSGWRTFSFAVRYRIRELLKLSEISVRGVFYKYLEVFFDFLNF